MKLFETSKYEAKYFCKICTKALSRYTLMHSYGTCPYCGHNSNSTVCDANKISILNTTWIELTLKPPFIKRITNEKLD